MADVNVLYVGPVLAGIAGGSTIQNRAEILIDSGGAGEERWGNAWMKGSGGGSVLCDTDGDVTITLGN